MLEELRITNFAIIDQLTLHFDGGFNVITGETGAGKSILIDAVDLLMGGKADSAFVRSGTDRAIIEGVFGLDERTHMPIQLILLREDLIDPNERVSHITLSRELRKSGRSSARLNGVTCSAGLLREVGEILVDIHGQSAHLSLFKPRAHMDLLDRYADLLEVRDALSAVVDNLADTRAEINRLQRDKAELQKQAERLRYEVDEINAAEFDPDEESELTAERNRLANSERLANLVSQANILLSGDEDDDSPSALDALMEVALTLDKLVEIDPELADEQTLANELSAYAQELAIAIAGYADEIDHDPHRLDELEERLELIKRMKRRYNVETIAEILTYAENAENELETLEHSEERLEELRQLEERNLQHIGDLAERISTQRQNAGKHLAKRVVRELQDLRMERTQFEVIIERHEAENGCYGKDGKRYAFDHTGIDQLEFMMSANPGEPLRPLAKVASGGEAARIMLALKRVLSQADETPILIFDEIDQGIGGRIGSVVGEKLWSLSDMHQVLCVTHLPQLAGYGDLHFHVAKGVAKKRTISQVSLLDNDESRVHELADMLGTSGESGLQSAQDILNAARLRKGELRSEEDHVQKNLL